MGPKDEEILTKSPSNAPPENMGTPQKDGSLIDGETVEGEESETESELKSISPCVTISEKTRANLHLVDNSYSRKPHTANNQAS